MNPYEQEAKHAEQLELPVSREGKLAIAAALAERAPPLVSRLVQRNMSRLISEIELTANAQGWSPVGQESLAARLELDARTLRRWEELATDLGLVEVIRGPGVAANLLYRVDWHAAGRLARIGADKSLFRPRDFVQDAPFAHDVAGKSDSPASRPESGKMSGVTGQMSGSHRTNVRSHHLPLSHSYLDKDPIAPIHHFPLADGARATEGNCPVTPDKCPVPADNSVPPDLRGGPRGKHGRFPLTVEMLGHADRVDEWFQWAEATGAAGVRQCDRQRIFAVARSVFRRAKAAAAAGKPGPGPGAFVALVKARNWIAAQCDDDWAVKAIRYLAREG